MITLLHGNDYPARAKAVAEHRARLEQQGYHLVSFFADDHETRDILNALNHQSLFGDTHAYILHGCLGDDEIMHALGSVTMPVLCIEDHFSKEISQKIYQYIEKQNIDIKNFSKKEEKDKEIFKITDPLYDRNPKQAWLAYQSLVHQGYDIHQILGTVWWQVKLMLLVARGGGRGVKEFPLNKARRALHNYHAQARETLAQRILDIYHRGHAGEDAGNLFEEFLLTLHKD